MVLAIGALGVAGLSEWGLQGRTGGVSVWVSDTGVSMLETPAGGPCQRGLQELSVENRYSCGGRREYKCVLAFCTRDAWGAAAADAVGLLCLVPIFV